MWMGPCSSDPRRAKPSAVLLAVSLVLCAGGAAAESLRCNGRIVSEGDTRLTVLRQCGQPALKDARCAPVFVGPQLQPVPDAFIGFTVPCVPIEDWLYERGEGYLPATVRFRSGVVQAIYYGQQSR